MKQTVKSLFALLACAALTAGLFAGCSCGQPQSSAEDTTTTMPSLTTRAIVEAKIDTLITAAEVSTITEETMSEGIVSGQGSTLTFVGTETMSVVAIDLDQKPYETFDYMLEGYPDLVYAPNIGTEAWWTQTYNQLLSYDKGYMISVEVSLPNKTNEERLIAARRITGWIIERLPESSTK